MRTTHLLRAMMTGTMTPMVPSCLVKWRRTLTRGMEKMTMRRRMWKMKKARRKRVAWTETRSQRGRWMRTEAEGGGRRGRQRWGLWCWCQGPFRRGRKWRAWGLCERKVKAIIANKKNPNIVSILTWRRWGLSTVEGVPKGGGALCCDVTDKSQLKKARKIDTNPPEGASWRVHHCDPIEQQEKEKRSKSHAESFKTQSNIEGDEKKQASRWKNETSKDSPRSPDKNLAKRSHSKKVMIGSPEMTPTKKCAPKESPKQPVLSKTSQTDKSSVASSRTSKSSFKEDVTTMKPDKGGGTDASKGSFSAKKGGDNVMRNDSDSDSLDLADEKDFCQGNERDSQGIEESQTTVDQCDWTFCQCGHWSGILHGRVSQARKNVLHEKWSLPCCCVHHCQKNKLFDLHADNGWTAMIKNIHACDKEFRAERKWQRTHKENTVDHMCFIHDVPTNNERSFGDLINERLKGFFAMTKKRNFSFAG